MLIDIDDQIQKVKQINSDQNTIEKYKHKLRDMESQYESKVTELMEELKSYKQASKKRSIQRSEGTKSSRSMYKSSKDNRRGHMASHSTFGNIADPEVSYREDIDADTDITPADELNSTERRKMLQNAENIGNDSLMINFYKKKLEDKNSAEFKTKKQFSKLQDQVKHHKSQNYSHRGSGPLKTRDDNIEQTQNSRSHQNSVYIQPGPQRQVSGYISKHYQIPKKEKCAQMETQGSTSSAQQIVDSFHKRSKSQNNQHVSHKKTKSEVPYSINFGQSTIESKENEGGDQYMISPNQGMVSESFDARTLKKSTTMDNTYKSVNGKPIHSNHGISGNINRSEAHYGVNDGVSSSCTWDLRKSTSYVSKPYIKNQHANGNYVKKPSGGYHK